MNEKKDTIYASAMSKVEDFSFDRNVADVFDDMLHRSIPGYGAIIHQLGSFAVRYVVPETNIYDLGCSLGAATFAVRSSVNLPGCQIHAVDLSTDMIARFEQRLSRHVGVIPVTAHCMDVADLNIENASLVIMNFTLQFIDFQKKERILQHIYDGMTSGGALVLSEKVVSDDSVEQQFIESTYFDLKRFNGYNDLEISQKRNALENVLKLDTPVRHISRLRAVGFSRVSQWYRNLNFASFVAEK